MTEEHRNIDKAAEDCGPITRADLRIVKAADAIADARIVQAIGKASELTDQPPMIAASLATLIAGLAVRRPKLARTGLRMLASHALATGFKTLVKDRIDRPRPSKVEEDGEHQVEQGESKDGDDRSLPSGHSAGATAVARAIVREYPRAAPTAYTASALAMLVQVARKAHFPSDILVGFAMGLAAEAVVSLVMKPPR